MSKFLDETGIAYFLNKIKALIPSTYAGSPTAGGVANKTSSIPYGELDSSSTATVMTATVPGITELKDGVLMYLRNGVITSAANFTININNLGAKPVYSSLAAASRSTTLFNINYTMMFIYNEDRVSGGCWDAFYGYDSNTNTIGYQIRTYSMSLPMSSVVYRYRLLFTSPDGSEFVPANNSTSTNATTARTVNQEKIDPFGRIVYYGTTASVAAGSRPGTAYLWEQYQLVFGYSFNTAGGDLTLTSWKPVYLKCAPQSDGSAIIDSTTPYVQDLPSTADGKIYIFLGVAYDATHIELTLKHPVYEYKDGCVRQWTNGKTSYNDLLDKPTIPDAVTWTQKVNSGTNIADITIGSVTTSVYAPNGGGSGTITGVTAGAGLSGGGTSGSVTLSHSNSVNAQATQALYPITIDGQGHIDSYGSAMSMPTKVSDLTNDSGFITGISSSDVTTALGYTPYNSTNPNGYISSYTETDPTVPSWAKASSKPTYTYSEVGALSAATAIPSKVTDLTNDAGYISTYTETDPTVPSWAKASSKPTYTYSEVGALSSATAIPTEATVSGWGFTKNAGTVTSIATGTGLSGGTITSSGTISLDTSYAVSAAAIAIGTDENPKLISAKVIADAIDGVTEGYFVEITKNASTGYFESDKTAAEIYTASQSMGPGLIKAHVPTLNGDLLGIADLVYCQNESGMVHAFFVYQGKSSRPGEVPSTSEGGDIVYYTLVGSSTDVTVIGYQLFTNTDISNAISTQISTYSEAGKTIFVVGVSGSTAALVYASNGNAVRYSDFYNTLGTHQDGLIIQILSGSMPSVNTLVYHPVRMDNTSATVVLKSELDDNNGKAIYTVVLTDSGSGLTGTYDVSYIPAGLPSVTSSDNGKVLMVVNGVWAAASLSQASGNSF